MRSKSTEEPAYALVPYELYDKILRVIGKQNEVIKGTLDLMPRELQEDSLVKTLRPFLDKDWRGIADGAVKFLDEEFDEVRI